jgi:polysaccharide transporter, PST family
LNSLATSLKKIKPNLVFNFFLNSTVNIVNSIFFVLLIPILIERLGIEKLGLFVYINAIISYLGFIINFGIDQIATKKLLYESKNNSELVRSVIFIRVSIFVLIYSLLIFFGFTFDVENIELYQIASLQLISVAIIPIWYYQSVHRQVFYTISILVSRLITFIFILFYLEDDIYFLFEVFAVNSILLSIFTLLNINKRIGEIFKSPNWLLSKLLIIEASPIFLSGLIGSLKEFGVPLIIGNFIGLSQLAAFDLANKIILLPRLLLANINVLIWPIVAKKTAEMKYLLNKIMRIEISLFFISFLIILFSAQFVIKFLGKDELPSAYLLSLILSISILTYLLVGAIQTFIFIPKGKTNLILLNQFLSFISFLFACLVFYKFKILNEYTIGLALSFSWLIEILFSLFSLKKIFTNELN